MTVQIIRLNSVNYTVMVDDRKFLVQPLNGENFILAKELYEKYGENNFTIKSDVCQCATDCGPLHKLYSMYLEAPFGLTFKEWLEKARFID